MKIDANFVEEDEMTAHMVFQEMSIADRFKALLYIIDNDEVKSSKIRRLLLTYKDYLVAIKDGNNNDKFETNEEGDKEMLKWAEKQLTKKHPKEKPKKVIPELPEDKAEEKYNEFYLLL